MSNKQKERIVYCDDCQYEWPYGQTKLDETNWRSSNGEKFQVMSFRCPNCGKEYIVSVDNEITISEKQEVISVQKSIGRASKQGRVAVYNMLWNKRERILARITKHQDVLKQAYLERKTQGMLEQVK